MCVRACVCVRVCVCAYFVGKDSNSDVIKIMLHKRFSERNPYISRGVPEQVSLVESHCVVCCIIVAMRTSLSTTLCSWWFILQM